MLAPGAHCAVHAEKAAVELCSRCGAFVCADCLELLNDTPYCQSCLERVGVKRQASRQSLVALVLTIAGFNCGFLPGIAGLVLAYRELARINRGEAPESGRNYAKVAKVLGWVNVGILVAVGLLFVGGLVFGLGAESPAAN
jgi:hypothetical protein